MYGPMSSYRRTSAAASPSVTHANAIVVATDVVPGHELDRARFLAREKGASLHRVRADGLAKPSSHAIDVSEAAEDVEASLVVVGSRPSWRGKTSFAERVHDVTDVPVLHVRNRVVVPYPHVVVALDASSNPALMTAAARFVAADDAVVEYLHAVEVPHEPVLLLGGAPLANLRHHRKSARESAREWMSARLVRAGLDESALRVELGSPVVVLRRVPKRALLVLQRGRSWLMRTVLGSVTRSMLQGGGADVLVV